MNKVTEEILQKRVVVDADGKEYPLHSETSREQGQFLNSLAKEANAQVCLEIGLAYGISSLFIAEAIAGKSAPKFISIDPMQKDWHDIGLLNLERAGFSPFVEFHRAYSHDVLPRLLASGQRIDFAYVDTCKVFDVVLVDAYYLSRLLRVGGILVFDDCSWPGINRVARYVAQWPHLALTHKHGVYKSTLKRRVFSSLIQFVPKKEIIFSDLLVRLDETVGTDAQCVAFKKTAEDQRNWDWYRNF